VPGGPGERNGAEAAGLDATATDATFRTPTVAEAGAGAATGANMAPLITEPPIQHALSTAITTNITTRLNVQALTNN
jgi:hypothetical protein